MRKYEGPEMEIVKFGLEDVVRTSGEIGNVGEIEKPDIDYNQQW